MIEKTEFVTNQIKTAMKKVILSLIFATCTGMFCSLNAQEYKVPAKVVVITKQDVNIRKAPQTSAAVVEKASTDFQHSSSICTPNTSAITPAGAKPFAT